MVSIVVNVLTHSNQLNDAGYKKSTKDALKKIYTIASPIARYLYVRLSYP